MSTHRHPAFASPQQTKAFDPSPDALTDAEITAVEEALSCGYTPRAKLIRKMLKLAKRAPTAYQDGVDWASGKVVLQKGILK